jgi:hypothetical protein
VTENDVPANEAKLEALLRADLPPARDALFRIAVLARRDRQQFQRRIAATVAVGLASVGLVGVTAAAISVWLAADGTRFAAAIGVAAAAVWMIPGGSRVVPSALRSLVPASFVRTLGHWLYPYP